MSSSRNLDRKALPKPGRNSIVIGRGSSEDQSIVRSISRSFGSSYGSNYRSPRTEAEKVFDVVINETGEFSLHLAVVFTMVILYTIAVLLMSAIGNFEEIPIIARCKIPALEGCLTFDQILNISTSKNFNKPARTRWQEHYCYYDDRPYQTLAQNCSYDYLLNAIQTQPSNGTKKCSDYVVRTVGFIVDINKWVPRFFVRDMMQLYCDETVWFTRFLFATHSGKFLIPLLIAPFPDIFGRKKIFVIASIMNLLSHLFTSVVNKIAYVILFFFQGFGDAACLCIYLLFVEQCSNVTLLWLGLLVAVLSPLSLVHILIFENSSWYHINFVVVGWLLLLLPTTICYVSESPRWLMFTGRQVQCWNVLSRLNSNIEPVLSNTSYRQPTFRSFLRFFGHPIFRKRLIVCLVFHLLLSIRSYFNDPSETKKNTFKVNLDVFYAWTIVSEIFALFFIYIIAILWGRLTTIFSYCCMLIIFDGAIFMENQYFKYTRMLYVLLHVRNIFNTHFYYLLLFYTAEIFPTSYRATALHWFLAASRLGNLLQSYNVFIIGEGAMSFIIPFMSSVTCALIVSLLPKTHNDGLPDTIKEAILLRRGL